MSVEAVLEESFRSQKIDEVAGVWPAKVEDVDDPEGLNRVRVRVFHYHGPIDQTPTEALPWADISHFGGGGLDYGSGGLLYPTGSIVWVMFEMGKTEFPVIIGGRQVILKRDPDSGNPHEYLTVGGKEESGTEKTWKPKDGHTMPHDVFDGPASDTTTHPTRTVWSKSFRGHTIVVEDKPGEEFLKIIDRGGQIIELCTPVEESDNEDNAEQRGVRDSIKDDQVDLDKVVGKKATIRIKDLSGQEILLHAEKDKEKIVLTSQNRDGSKQQKVTLSREDESITLDQDGLILIIKADKIENGKEGAGDKASLDSKVQTEFGRVDDHVNDTLVIELNIHEHPAPDFVFPLIPLGNGPTLKNDNNPPAGVAVGPSLPITPPGFTKLPTKGDTNSELVTIDK